MAMRILIVGAGAVGGYFGARLAEAGRDVTFLVRPSRAAQLRQDGLRIISPHGDLSLRPKLVSSAQIGAPYDLIFLSVKAYALESAIDDFAAGIGPQTMVLPVLNGMRQLDLLTRRFGTQAVIGGVCLVAAEIDHQGRIVQMADFQELAYGELSGEVTPRLRSLDSTLQGAGFEAHLSTDIEHAMWEKWVQLASLGALTCLMRAAIGDIAAATGGTELALAILEECSAIAAACGHRPSTAFLARHSSAITKPGSALTSSMYRDLRKGAPVEAEHILGDLFDRGAAHGLTTPLLKASLVNLRVYQAAALKSAADTPPQK
jgi:2-dehydropantoate 2-reductase